MIPSCKTPLLRQFGRLILLLLYTLVSQVHASPISLAPRANSTSYLAPFLAGEPALQPARGCEAPCAPLIQDLGTCEDDSCVCSQDGANDFMACAACDTRLSMKRGVVNLTATMEDLIALCEYQNYSMAAVTFSPIPPSASPSASSTGVLEAQQTGDATGLLVQGAQVVFLWGGVILLWLAFDL